MKKGLQWVGALGLVGVMTLALLYVVAGDRYMPWVAQEFVYVETDATRSRALDEGGYDYTLPYISQSGKKGEITFYAGKKLRDHAYLKIDAKGNYVASWEEVQANELPTVVASGLKSTNIN